MSEINKIYEAFGELIYAVAKADGSIQHEERDALEEILEGHPWAKDVIWSFNYEQSKTSSVQHAYMKALDIFKEHGPFPEYEKFVMVLTEVAAAFDGISDAEKELIQNFKNDLKDAFLNNPNIR